MRKMIKAWREKAVRVSFLAALLFLMNTMTVYATGGGIGGSKLATGTQQLIQDSTTFLMVIAPIVAGRRLRKCTRPLHRIGLKRRIV